MGITLPDGPGPGQGDDQGEIERATPLDPADPRPTRAVRSWVVSGAREFTVDPRRRLGGHGHARRVLAEDRRSVTSIHGSWRQLVSALQRHTVHSGLAQLSAEERQVITLAYLEGRTNNQIADLLGVSVSTVRRRIWLALDHLEQYVRRSGTWLSALLVLVLVHGIGRAPSVGRAATVAGTSHWLPKLGAGLAAVSVTTAALGLVAASPQPLSRTTQSRSNVTHVQGPLARTIRQVPIIRLATTSESTEQAAGERTAKPAGQVPETRRDPERDGNPKTGCHGKPAAGQPDNQVEPPGTGGQHSKDRGCKSKDVADVVV